MENRCHIRCWLSIVNIILTEATDTIFSFALDWRGELGADFGALAGAGGSLAARLVRWSTTELPVTTLVRDQQLRVLTPRLTTSSIFRAAVLPDIVWGVRSIKVCT